nr:hypothetical protein CFP56_23864 [Quercus suber]
MLRHVQRQVPRILQGVNKFRQIIAKGSNRSLCRSGAQHQYIHELRYPLHAHRSLVLQLVLPTQHRPFPAALILPVFPDLILGKSAIIMEDIDMDLGFEEEDEMQAIQAQADRIAAEAADMAATTQLEGLNGVGEVVEDGEVNEMEPVAKMHIRGLENFKPQDVEDYAAEHYSTDLFKRVQWIDDNHANFVYDTEAAAEEALQAFSAEEVEDRLEFRPAKPLSTHPDVKLEIRQAVLSDVKAPGAKDRSRFYLLNPEFDPDSKPRGQRHTRGRGRGEHAGYNRRSSRDDETFHEDFYDDGPKPAAARKELIHGSSSQANGRDSRRDYRGAGRNVGIDLIAGKQSGRLRDSRSKSPLRDGDGKYGFMDDQPQRQTARHRSRTPPHLRRDTHDAREQKRRELFPGKKTKELFPEHRIKANASLHQDQIADGIGDINLLRSNDQGFEFKGKGRAKDRQDEFSILGASKIKELFPTKVSKGKDLFEGRTTGRSTLRNKAEDLF